MQICIAEVFPCHDCEGCLKVALCIILHVRAIGYIHTLIDVLQVSAASRIYILADLGKICRPVTEHFV